MAKAVAFCERGKMSSIGKTREANALNHFDFDKTRVSLD